jgi:small subunit ribosomal protein S1
MDRNTNGILETMDPIRMEEDAPEASGGESFAELLNKSMSEPGRLGPGQKVRVRIVKITADWIFVDLGRKGEGCLDRRELEDAEGNLTVKEEDVITVYFLSAGENELRFTTKIAGGAAGRAQLEDAWRNGIPVDGYVVKEIKGGYEVRIAGHIRAFCPYSRMELTRVKDPGEHVGKHLPFRIAEFSEKGRNIVLSRREILEEERRAKREALKESLREGAIVRGTIVRILAFGAFVDIGGIEGLLPVSEVDWGRVEDIRDALSVGQEMDVVVTQIDWEKGRISLSLKRTLADPWETAAEKYPEGTTLNGTIARLAAFGAFVTLEPGVDGLIHISKLGGGKRIKHPGDVVREGQAVAVKVEKVDAGNRRIALALAANGRREEAQREEKSEEEEDYRRYAAERPRSLGSLGEVLSARLAEKAKGEKA